MDMSSASGSVSPIKGSSGIPRISRLPTFRTAATPTTFAAVNATTTTSAAVNATTTNSAVNAFPPAQDAKSHLPSPIKSAAPRPSPTKPSLPLPQPSLSKRTSSIDPTPSKRTSSIDPTPSKRTSTIEPSLSKRASIIGTPSRMPPPRTKSHTSSQSLQLPNKRSSIYGQRPASIYGQRPDPSARPASSHGHRPDAYPRPASRLARPSPSKAPPSQTAHHPEDSDDRLGSLGGFRATSRQSIRPESPTDLEHYHDQTTPPQKRSSRPSLSDRTIESLSRLPPTPTTDRRTSITRRRSSFFSPQSPMGPPSRPVSSMAAGLRPGSSDGPFARPPSRLSSPAKRPVANAKPVRASVDYSAVRSTPSKPNPATAVPRSAQLTSRTSYMGTTRPVSMKSTNGPTGSRLPGNPAAIAATTAEPRTAFKAPLSRRQSTIPAAPATQDRAEAQAQPPSKTSNTSSTLKDQIAKAKAAKRAATTKSETNQINGSGEFDLSTDPFNVKPKDNKGLLLKRIDAARVDGRLNIAAMGLKDIPGEVLRMYDAEEMANSKIIWSETVDLARLMAADNEFETLSDDIFPDVDTSPGEIVDDDVAKGLQFRGLDMLDLHGNLLSSVPIGLRRLERLTVLNLSHNKLNNTAWDVLSQLDAIEELRLGHNNFTAYLPQNLSRLRNLRTLELQSNKLLSLPEGLRELTNLRILNVSSNQLTGVPMDALQALPLVELNFSNNGMVGALFGFSVSEMSKLESLDVSNNSLASLAFSETLFLPALKTLNIANNRMVALPDVSGWKSLATLAAGNNKISQLPAGFSSLEHLRHADFTSNDLTKLPDDLGLMECLENLTIVGNPLKVRRFLTMSTEHLKRDLRNRSKSDEVPATGDDFEDEGIDIQPQGNMQPWKLHSGVLDLANKSLVNEDADDLRAFLGSNPEVRELVLAKNSLSMIPFEISMAQNLRSLDMSNCSLGGQYLNEVVHFQSLKELNLTGNKIVSWEPLLEFFLAPRLEQLDLSNNRLVGSVPVLRTSYPNLRTLAVRDNRIDAVSAESLKGLHAADLSNNNIGYLPPEVGLLWDHGLKGLNVAGNAFRVPSHRVLEKGTEALLAYLRDKILESLDEETF